MPEVSDQPSSLTAVAEVYPPLAAPKATSAMAVKKLRRAREIKATVGFAYDFGVPRSSEKEPDPG